MLAGLDLAAAATAATHAPEVLAVALRSPDKRPREAARALLMAHGAPALQAFLATQKSSHRATSEARIKKLLRAVGRSGSVDIVRFTAATAQIAHAQEDVVLCSDILSVARRLGQPARPLLAAFPPITTLYLEDIDGAVPAGLGALAGLQELALQGPGLRSGAGIEELAGLADLRLLRSWLPVADLHLYDPIRHLTWLEFYGSLSKLTDISALSGWRKLAYLNLKETGVTDISALSGLVGLATLQLASTKITDITPLSGLPRLERLDLSRLKQPDLRVLATLPSLKDLALDFVPVGDLSVLSPCTKLRSLRLWGETFDSLAPLVGLPLERLELLYTATPGLDALAEIPTLRSLRLVRTRVDEDALARLLVANPTLQVLR